MQTYFNEFPSRLGIEPRSTTADYGRFAIKLSGFLSEILLLKELNIPTFCYCLRILSSLILILTILFIITVL